MDKVILLSNQVWIAENASNGNMQAKFVICDFSKNKNGVRLNRDTIENWMLSMVNQPLVGKIKKDVISGIADFTGHNMKKSTIKNSDGEYETVVEFDTDAIGVFTDVDIEDVDGVECIVGTAEIWSRYPRVVNLIRERIESGTLQTSWEISVVSARSEDDEKIIDDGVFTALACLGKRVEPAYDTSRLLEVAEADTDDELTSAIVEDLEEAMKKNEQVAPVEETIVTSEEDETVETEELEVDPESVESDAEAGAEPDQVEEPEEQEAPVESESKTSTLTVGDLSRRIYDAIREKLKSWGYIIYWFPESHMVWWKCEEAPSELDLLSFVYEVMEDDTVVVDDGIPVKLTVSIAEAQNELAKKDEAIAAAATEIAELKKSLDALTSFKEAFEKAEAERIEAERVEQRANLKAYALKSGLISEKDCASKEIAQMIEDVDEAGIKQLIASRYMESLDAKSTQKHEGVMTSSLMAEESKPIKANAVMAYITR